MDNFKAPKKLTCKSRFKSHSPTVRAKKNAKEHFLWDTLYYLTFQCILNISRFEERKYLLKKGDI